MSVYIGLIVLDHITWLLGMARATDTAPENTIHSLLQCETCGTRTICRKSDVKTIFINVKERNRTLNVAGEWRVEMFSKSQKYTEVG